MKEAEIINFEDVEGDTGSPRVSKKNPRTLNPDVVSHEGVASAFLAPHIDSLSPEEILILREEGKLPESDSNEVLERKDLERRGEEMLVAMNKKEEMLRANRELEGEEMLRNMNEREEMLSATKEEGKIVIKERAALVSKKISIEKDNLILPHQSHGPRGREPKYKNKKGLKTTKYN